MNENLDLTEILKDCPKGTKLYSPALGECTLDALTDDKTFPIRVKYKTKHNTFSELFTENGYLFSNTINAECMLFPSKDQRDWSKWQRSFVKGDILVSKAGNIVLCSHIDEAQLVHYHCLLNFLGVLKIRNDVGVGYSHGCTLANDFQKQKLFDALKKEGYEWDAEKKDLKKIEEKFKDGDIVATNDGKYIAIIENNGGKYYVCCHPNVNYFNIDGSGWFDRLATEEEKQILFDTIKENGYKWNAETKTLEKIKKEKFDPKTLQPFDKVLVRDFNNQNWMACLFSHIDNNVRHKFRTVDRAGWYHCIPFNDDTKHLVGKSDEAPEFYRYWEE